MSVFQSLTVDVNCACDKYNEMNHACVYKCKRVLGVKSIKVNDPL